MSSDDRAESWLQQQLDTARVALRASPPSGRDLSLDDHARQLRSSVALYLLPIEPYVGLTLSQAAERAASEGRRLVDRTGATGRRADFVWGRVNVRMDPGGRVVDVSRDTAPWDGAGTHAGT